MELVIYKPADNQFLSAIEFNYQEIKQELTLRLEKYKGLVYTEDSIKDAKADRAALNKFETALNDKKIEVKKQCLKPYEDFETKVKELMGMVSSVSGDIDSQVKAFEQKQKDDKKAEIRAYYDEHIGDLVKMLPFERLFSEKWLNATVKLAACQKEIDDAITRVTSDLAIIDGLQSEFALQIKDKYLQSLDLSAALKEKERLEAVKAQQEEYKRQQEIKKAEAAARAAEEASQIIEASPVETKPDIKVVYESVHTEALKVNEVDFRIWATDVQLMTLRAFLKANGIKYGKVE